MTGYGDKKYVETANKSGPNETLQSKPITTTESLLGFYHSE
jgi:hypothetical protein